MISSARRSMLVVIEQAGSRGSPRRNGRRTSGRKRCAGSRGSGGRRNSSPCPAAAGFPGRAGACSSPPRRQLRRDWSGPASSRAGRLDPGVQDGPVGDQVGVGAAVRLHVGVVAAEELARLLAGAAPRWRRRCRSRRRSGGGDSPRRTCPSAGCPWPAASRARSSSRWRSASGWCAGRASSRTIAAATCGDVSATAVRLAR